jgi:transcriptional regulator with PAS, ATPase and Fis domain
MSTTPRSAEAARLLELAKGSLFGEFAELCDGMLVVDREARIAWMSDRYPRRLGIGGTAEAIGRPVEEVIPHSLMRDVVTGGRPIMLDIMEVGSESLVVTRLPLHDEAGAVIGAVGFVLYGNASQLAPVLSRYQRLRADLADAQQKLAEARRTKYTFSNFVGATPACALLKHEARRAARSISPVLLLGETGTGKELLAQAIHAASPRAAGPFVAVNIAAIPETLLEAEFFGVAPGAYTGADRRGREGKFKLADGGTLFLDEIGDMSPPLQAKLLRALQEREVEPVGSNRLTPVDVRIISATSRDLAREIAAGHFRADLYYRLNVVSLNIPPLRNRLDDLPQLCEFLVDDISRKLALPPRDIPAAVIARLGRHDWPGNVRELANTLERALLMADGDALSVADVDRCLPAAAIPAGSAGASAVPATATLARTLAEAEREAIGLALRDCQGNKVQAARQLGISRATLYEKLSALKLGD